MACAGTNTPIQRYVIRIELAQGSLGPALGLLGSGLYSFKTIVGISGLSEGSQGSVTLNEQGKKFEVTDGIVKIGGLGLQLREDFDTAGILEQEFFEEWWAKRNEVLCNVYVDLTDRKWCLLNEYRFYGCSFKSKSTVDRVLGQTVIGTQDFEFLPYEIERLNAAEVLGDAIGFS